MQLVVRCILYFILQNILFFRCSKKKIMYIAWCHSECFYLNVGLLSFSHPLGSTLKSIVSHCRSSIHCSTPTVEEQIQEEEQEGTFPFKLFLIPILFSSPPFPSAQFPFRRHQLCPQRPTARSVARARLFWRRTPDTFSLRMFATEVPCTPFLGWRASRLHLCFWCLLVMQQPLRD